MRILKELQIERFKVTVFFWNDKYLIKFENGSNEITYKVKKIDITSEEDVETFFTQSRIIEKTKEVFSKMDEALEAFFESI